jgi:hypothetical protein
VPARGLRRAAQRDGAAMVQARMDENHPARHRAEHLCVLARGIVARSAAVSHLRCPCIRLWGRCPLNLDTVIVGVSSDDGSPPRPEPSALGCCFCFSGAASAASIAPDRRRAERIERSGRPAWPHAALSTESAAIYQDREASCDPRSSETSEPRPTSWIPRFRAKRAARCFTTPRAARMMKAPAAGRMTHCATYRAAWFRPAGAAGRDQRGQGPSDLSARRNWRSPPQHRPALERPKAPLASERCGRAVCCAWRSHGGGQARPAAWPKAGGPRAGLPRQ